MSIGRAVLNRHRRLRLALEAGRHLRRRRWPIDPMSSSSLSVPFSTTTAAFQSFQPSPILSLPPPPSCATATPPVGRFSTSTAARPPHSRTPSKRRPGPSGSASPSPSSSPRTKPGRNGAGAGGGPRNRGAHPDGGGISGSRLPRGGGPHPSRPHGGAVPPTATTTAAAEATTEEDWEAASSGTPRPYDDGGSSPREVARRYRKERRLLLDRLADLQRAHRAAVEEYRQVWYPSGGGRRASGEGGNDGSPRSKGTRTSWRRAIEFKHPPLSATTWRQVVESEDIFRRLCTHHHELFVASSSLLGVEAGQRVHLQLEEDGGAADTAPFGGASSDTTDAPPRHMRPAVMEDGGGNGNGAEGVFASVLPYWEALRKERAEVVDHCRPPPPPPPPPAGGDGGDTTPATATPWIASMWQKVVDLVVGPGQPPSEDSVPVTAHLDATCAPNHFHYNKLVGWLYFLYFPQRQEQQKQQRDQRQRQRLQQFQPPQGGPGVADDNEKRDDVRGGGDAVASHDDNDPLDTAAAILLAPPPSSSSSSSSSLKSDREWLLRHRAAMIQNVVDQCPAPNQFLSPKIVRLLVRSYQDIGTLEASRQAERVYNRHPLYQRGLLWYVLDGYLQVVLQGRSPAEEEEGLFEGRLGSSEVGWGSFPPPPAGETGRTARPRSETRAAAAATDAALAARRICELLSSLHGRDRNEFLVCSVIGFRALASVRPDALDGYYERVHSLGILKFGPQTWSALIRSNSQNQDPPPLAGEARSPPPAGMDGVGHTGDLAAAFHPRDHKTLHHLIEIYTQDKAYTGRAFDLLETAFELYPPERLQDSFRRSTFHRLMDALHRERRRKKRLQGSSKAGEIKSNNNISITGDGKLPEPVPSSSTNPELDRALRLVDKMVLHSAWTPNKDTFLRLFELVEDGPDAERVRVVLELCQFLSEDGTPPFSPLRAAKYSLNAWALSLRKVAKGDVDAAGGDDPVDRAWNVLLALRSTPAPLFPSHDDDGGLDKDEDTLCHPDTGFSPMGSLYNQVLKMCVSRRSERSLDVTLKVFEIVKREGLLTYGSVCLNILRSVANSRDHLRRVLLTKEVYRAAMDATKDDATPKAQILRFMRKEMTYYRRHHPDLYETHLAELSIGIDGYGPETSTTSTCKELDDHSEEEDETA
jgi:hypothetical protein